MRYLSVLIGSLFLSGTPAAPLDAQGPQRIIAIGDVQGALDRLKAVLTVTGLTDANNRWTGGRTQLVQTGNYMDHGAGTRAVLDLLMSLEQQAKDAGGRATALLGPHEVLNVLCDTQCDP